MKSGTSAATSAVETTDAVNSATNVASTNGTRKRGAPPAARGRGRGRGRPRGSISRGRGVGRGRGRGRGAGRPSKNESDNSVEEPALKKMKSSSEEATGQNGVGEDDADVAETEKAVKAIRLGSKSAKDNDVTLEASAAGGSSAKNKKKKGKDADAQKKKKDENEKKGQKGSRGPRVHRPEYDEIWKDIYLAGTEWDQMKQVYDIDWDFDHLDHALTDGDLSGKRVFLFGATEPQLVRMNAKDVKGEVVPIPTIVAVVSETPPPSRVGIKSVQRTVEEIVDMSELRIEWQAYTPANLATRLTYKPLVSVLACSQRKARLRNMQEEAVHRYDYVLPYFFDPEKQEEVQEETEVQVLADLEGLQAPLMCEFDYELDELDEFVDEKIEEQEDLDKSKHKEALKTAIKTAVKAAKEKFRREKAERQRQIDAISPEQRALIKNTKLIKFYPANEWPGTKECQSKYINRYYGKASEVRDDFPDDEGE